MKHIYLVFAGTEYEGSSPVYGFERRADADNFRAFCEAHEAKRPKCPGYELGEPDDANEAEWAEFHKAKELWQNAHPAGLLGHYNDQFSVGRIDVLPRA